MRMARRNLLVAAWLVVCGFVSTTVFGQVYQVITLDENGDGYITPSQPFPYTVTNEPNSGISTLRYTLPFAGVAGDLLLQEPVGTNISDVLRFDGNSHVYFFSDIELGQSALADVGIPTTFLSPNVTVVEQGTEGVNTWAFYIPSAGQPGYKAAGPVAYDIISDVPEPSSLLLVGLGGGLLLLVKSRQLDKRI